MGPSLRERGALAGGCGSGSAPPSIIEVEGTVLLDGKPLNKVEVQFIPATNYGREYLARGVTDDQGRFQLTCKGQPGACAGENYVLVKKSEIPRNLLSENKQVELRLYLKSLGTEPPVRYGNAAESPLRVTVTADQKEYDLKLESD